MANEQNLKSWRPGQSGNPGGRPRKRLIDDALEDLLSSNDAQAARDVASALLKRARRGDLRAIQLIAERTQGKPTGAVEISGPDGGALEIDRMTDEELDQRINELMAQLKIEHQK